MTTTMTTTYFSITTVLSDLKTGDQYCMPSGFRLVYFTKLDDNTLLFVNYDTETGWKWITSRSSCCHIRVRKISRSPLSMFLFYSCIVNERGSFSNIDLC